VTTKLGVVVLARPENGGTYQYTLSMLQALRHTSGFDITLYGDPTDPELVKSGFRIAPFAESRQRQLIALAADRLGVKLADPFAAEDMLLAPIYSLTLLHTETPFAYTLHDLQEKHYPGNFSIWQRTWRHQIHARLLRRAARVICESSYVRTDIVRYFGFDERRVAVIAAPPQGSSSPKWTPGSSKPRASGWTCPSGSCSILRNSGRTRTTCGWSRRFGGWSTKLAMSVSS